MRLTQWGGLGFPICAVFRQHQRSKGHRDDLFGLPAVRPCTGDLGQLQEIQQDEFRSALVLVLCVCVVVRPDLIMWYNKSIHPTRIVSNEEIQHWKSYFESCRTHNLTNLSQ